MCGWQKSLNHRCLDGSRSASRQVGCGDNQAKLTVIDSDLFLQEFTGSRADVTVSRIIIGLYYHSLV